MAEKRGQTIGAVTRINDFGAQLGGLWATTTSVNVKSAN